MLASSLKMSSDAEGGVHVAWVLDLVAAFCIRPSND